MDESGSDRQATAAAALEARGIDLDPARRPGVPRMRASPAPLPNAIAPPSRQRSDVTVLRHGRPHKTLPPVFGTAVPPRGLSGLVRRAAYHWPDHHLRHWTLLLLADRVDLWEHRARRLAPVAVPVLAMLGALAAVRARR